MGIKFVPEKGRAHVEFHYRGSYGNVFYRKALVVIVDGGTIAGLYEEDNPPDLKWRTDKCDEGFEIVNIDSGRPADCP